MYIQYKSTHKSYYHKFCNMIGSSYNTIDSDQRKSQSCDAKKGTVGFFINCTVGDGPLYLLLIVANFISRTSLESLFYLIVYVCR